MWSWELPYWSALSVCRLRLTLPPMDSREIKPAALCATPKACSGFAPSKGSHASTVTNLQTTALTRACPTARSMISWRLAVGSTGWLLRAACPDSIPALLHNQVAKGTVATTPDSSSIVSAMTPARKPSQHSTKIKQAQFGAALGAVFIVWIKKMASG